MKRSLILFAAGCLYPFSMPAQDNAELLARLKAMEERIQTLEAEVQQLKGQQATATPTPAPAPVAQMPTAQAPPTAPGAAGGASLPYYGGSQAAASKVFNPDISVIGDFIGAIGNGGARPIPAFEM